MDVVLVLVAALILCLSYETVSYNEPQLNEQFHSVVERSPRYAKVARFEQFTEFLKGEMSVGAYKRRQGWRIAPESFGACSSRDSNRGFPALSFLLRCWSQSH